MKTKFHRAWLVYVGVLLIQFSMMGVMVNCVSVLMAAIRLDMGFTAGSLSIYYTLRQLCMGAGIGFMSKYYLDSGKKAWIPVGIYALLSGASFLLMPFYTKVWHWYISGIFMGVAMGGLVMGIPVTINNWFNKNRGLFVGLSAACCGFAGAILSPVVSSIITNSGWRAAATFIGLLCCAMSLIGGFLLVPAPGNVDCKPWGDLPVKEVVQKEDDDERKPVPGWMFVAVTAVFMLTSSIVSMANQMPTFNQSVGYTLQQASLFTSVTMIGNIAGKMALGAISDRYGVYKAIRLNLYVICCSMVIFLIAAKSLPLMYLGSFFFGLSYSIGTVGPSQMFLDVYGRKVYRDKMRAQQSIGSYFSAGMSFVIPMIFDLTGSFNLFFIYGAAVCVGVSLWLFSLAKVSRELKN